MGKRTGKEPSAASTITVTIVNTMLQQESIPEAWWQQVKENLRSLPEKVLLRLANNTRTDADVLVELSSRSVFRENVVVAATKNPSLPGWRIVELLVPISMKTKKSLWSSYLDYNYTVVYAALQNPSIPLDVLVDKYEKLFSSPRSGLRYVDMERKTSVSDEVLPFLLNPALPDEQFDQIIKTGHLSVSLQLAETRGHTLDFWAKILHISPNRIMKEEAIKKIAELDPDFEGMPVEWVVAALT